MHYTSKVKDSNTKNFIDNSCLAFFSRINSFYNQENFYDLFLRFTESSLCHLYSQGLIKHYGLERFNYFSELGVSKNEREWGRVDLFIEDYKDKLLYVFEAKNFWSSETEPSTPRWGKEKTQQFYRETIDQAKQYIAQEKPFHHNKIILVSLVFSRVEFKNPLNLFQWNFENIDQNEFYGFESYSFSNKLMGIGIYGFVEDWGTSTNDT